MTFSNSSLLDEIDELSIRTCRADFSLDRSISWKPLRTPKNKRSAREPTAPWEDSPGDLDNRE